MRRYRPTTPEFRAHLRNYDGYEPVDRRDLFYIEHVGDGWGSSLSLIFSDRYSSALSMFLSMVAKYPEHSIMLLAALPDDSWQELAAHSPEEPYAAAPATFWQQLGDAFLGV